MSSRREETQLDVVHVAETIRGGIATYLREILPLQVQRFGPDRVVMIAPGSQLADLGEQPGISLIAVDKASTRLGTAWQVRRALSQLLANQDTRILHVHSAFAGMVCRGWPLPADRIQGLVYCPHGWAFIRLSRSSRIAAYVERVLSRRCDAIVCVSYSERNAALHARLPEHKLSVIHNGLPDRSIDATDASSLWRSDVLRLVFAGRFDRQKGFDVLLAALRRLERKVQVQVFGESVIGEYSESEVLDTMHLHGWQDFETMAPYLASCDAVVMPSRWEGLSISALEAMRAGKPLIATPVGGLVEVVEDGITGVFTPAGDISGLANILQSASAERLAEMGTRARTRFMNHFLIDDCEKALSALYCQILDPAEQDAVRLRQSQPP